MADFSMVAQAAGRGAVPDPSTFPVFYDQIVPLSSSLHPRCKVRQLDHCPKVATANAIPLTIDEFVSAQRHYPVVFSSGDRPVPLALMGLNNHVNVFFDREGRPLAPVYVPAYVRRYPFILARLDSGSEDLSLCYDPTSGLVGDEVDGQALFANGQQTEVCRGILRFCEDFEVAAQRTTAFVARLQDMHLLIDGEITISPPDAPEPFVYRGFRMVDEARMHALDADTRRRLDENGMWPLLFAHLMSLPLLREVFARQQGQGRIPR